VLYRRDSFTYLGCQDIRSWTGASVDRFCPPRAAPVRSHTLNKALLVAFSHRRNSKVLPHLNLKLRNAKFIVTVIVSAVDPEKYAAPPRSLPLPRQPTLSKIAYTTSSPSNSVLSSGLPLQVLPVCCRNILTRSIDSSMGSSRLMCSHRLQSNTTSLRELG